MSSSSKQIQRVKHEGHLGELRKIGLPMVCAAGLLLAMASMVSPGQPQSATNVAKQLATVMPGRLFGMIVVAWLGVALLLFVKIARRPRRRHMEEDEIYDMSYEPPRVTPRVIASLLMLMLIPVGLMGGLLWLSYAGTSNVEQLSVSFADRIGGTQIASQHVALAVVRSDAASAIIGTLALVSAVTMLALVGWLYWGSSRLWPLHQSNDAPLRPPLREADVDNLEAVRLERDPRKAIVKCYDHFERSVAFNDLPRAPWQTSLEFMETVLRQLDVPHDAVRELTRLFEIARFSKLPLSAGDRDTAWLSLLAIRGALERQDGHVTSS